MPEVDYLTVHIAEATLEAGAEPNRAWQSIIQYIIASRHLQRELHLYILAMQARTKRLRYSIQA
jgi:hypothetical protein